MTSKAVAAMSELQRVRMVIEQKLEKKRVIHLTARNNNTFLNLTDGKGRTILVKSLGNIGVHGGKKKLSLNSWNLGNTFGNRIREIDGPYQRYDLHLHAWGHRKVNTLMGLRKAGIRFSAIIDKTSVPHGGCRLKKMRRL